MVEDGSKIKIDLQKIYNNVDTFHKISGLPNYGSQLAFTFQTDVLELPNDTIYNEYKNKFFEKGFSLRSVGLNIKTIDENGKEIPWENHLDRNSIGVAIYTPYFIRQAGLESDFNITDFADRTYYIENKKTKKPFDFNKLNDEDKLKYGTALLKSINEIESSMNVNAKEIKAIQVTK